MIVCRLARAQVHVHGVLPDGRELCYSLPDGVGGFEPPELVGWDVPSIGSRLGTVASVDVLEMLGKDDFFVKAFLESGSEQLYMLQHVSGFVNKYAFLRPNEVTRIFEAQLDAISQSISTDPDAVEVEQSEANMLVEASQPDSHHATGRPRRQALLTMHLLGTEEGADGSEFHEFALQALTDQVSMFTEGKEASPPALGGQLSTVVKPTHETMPDIMKAMLESLEGVRSGAMRV
jgi:hypothetical protein